jgi:hypothetical protein
LKIRSRKTRDKNYHFHAHGKTDRSRIQGLENQIT